jgi:hypothetical protein
MAEIRRADQKFRRFAFSCRASHAKWPPGPGHLSQGCFNESKETADGQLAGERRSPVVDCA